MSLELRIKYHDDKYGTVKRLEKIEKGNWIDVYSAQDMIIPSIFENIDTIKQISDEINSIMKSSIEIDEIFTTCKSQNTEFYNEIGQKYKERIEYFINQRENLMKPYLIPLGFSLELPENGEAELISNFMIQSINISNAHYKGEYSMQGISPYTSIELKKNDIVGRMKIDIKTNSFTFREITNEI